MKERIFTTKEQGRMLVEAGLPISTAIGFRDQKVEGFGGTRYGFPYKCI
jgi:hypothetical protein